MKLRECPFCGGGTVYCDKKLIENSVLIEREFKRRTASYKYRIRCGDCSCGTPFMFYFEDAIAAWNRRVGDDLKERMDDDGR